MAIGSEKSLIAARRRPGGRLVRAFRIAYARWYGNSDLHTHIRWRAIRRAVVPAPSVVDVGCGDGVITIEIARTFPGVVVQGIELDPYGHAAAEQTKRELGIENVSFVAGDVSTLDFEAVNAALLLDVLEHLPDETHLLGSLGRAMEPGGTLIISTPTPNYPRFFGREFHEAVGHVRDGYSPAEVARLLEPAGFTVTAASYYTKLPSSLVCAIYYRYLWRGRLGMLLSPVLNAVSWLDALWPWRTGASSILVTATRGRGPAIATVG
jgi:2-polyprenyl-3-methyl-5-hydroxy-6-metoxy-1,4-benzoquinol methylase